VVAIFVVLTILVFVSVDVIVQRRRSRQKAGMERPVSVPSPVRDLDRAYSLPGGLFLDPGHAWAEMDPSGRLRVGVDEFVTRAMGQPDGVGLKSPGEFVAQGEPILEIEREGKRLSVRSPASGEIVSANGELGSEPGRVAKDPYGNGWMYLIKPSRLGLEIKGLMVAEAARAWLNMETRRFERWVEGRASEMAAVQDGGALIEGVLAHLDDEDWRHFQTEFLFTGRSGPDHAY